MEGRVVVNLTCRLYFHADREYFSARCRELGMTAFGKTADDALEHFKSHFNEAIDAYREQGALRKVLENSGVQWHWEQDAPAGLTFEDTGVTPTPRLAVDEAAVKPAVGDDVEESASPRELELVA